MRVAIKSSQDVEYELGERAWAPMETLRTAWDALPISDLFHLHALTRKTAEKDLGSKNVYLRLLDIPNSWISVLSDDGVTCRLTISNLSAGIESFNQGKVAPVLLKLSLKGTPVQQEGLALCARQQATQMEATLASKLSPRIEGVVFGNANELAQAVADEVHSAKLDLAKHLDVRVLKVETGIRSAGVSFTSDQDINAAMDLCEELEHPMDESIDHDSGLRSTVPVEMSTNSGDNAHQDLQIEASPTMTTASTQAMMLRRLIWELDVRLSAFSWSLPAQITSADANPHTSSIDATIPTRGKMERGVVVALGSNVGNKIEEIEKACRAIDADPDMRIVDTSFLYETKPMYVEDQERFVNGACEVSEEPNWDLQSYDINDRR
jgi:hypothetical protein